MDDRNDPVRDEEIYDLYGRFISSAYPSFLRRFGLKKTATRAEGARITDSSGKVYIDCVAGYGLFNLGHNHPKIAEAVKAQIDQKVLFTRPLISDLTVQLAVKISEIAPGDLTCSFLCNSGSEAIDSAIKLARLAKGKPGIIAAEKAFHGYTFGALSVSGIGPFKRAFGPLLPEIAHVPFGDVDAIEEAISEKTAAVILEPIQHESGVRLPAEDYLRQVRGLCTGRGVLLILDEIKTGMGKTGRMFACEHFGVVPDILVIGKSLGGGLMPIGAVIARRELWRKFSYSFAMSASSFAGNALASRAAAATIDVLKEGELIRKCALKGTELLRRLKQCVLDYPNLLSAANGIGLLMSVTCSGQNAAFQIAKEMIGEGVLVLPAYGSPSSVMIEPPMVISSEELEMVGDALERACKIVGDAK